MKFSTLFFTFTLSLAAHASSNPDSIVQPPPPVKSEGVAYAWAIGGTILGAPLGGFIWGPSLGQFYAGSNLQGGIGIAARGTGGLLFIAGLVQAIQCGVGGDCSNAGGTLATSGLILLGGGTIYSFIDTHFAVKRANERARAAKAASTLRFDLFPTLSRNTDGSQRAGMMARVGF